MDSMIHRVCVCVCSTSRIFSYLLPQMACDPIRKCGMKCPNLTNGPGDPHVSSCFCPSLLQYFASKLLPLFSRHLASLFVTRKAGYVYHASAFGLLSSPHFLIPYKRNCEVEGGCQLTLPINVCTKNAFTVKQNNWQLCTDRKGAIKHWSKLLFACFEGHL